MVLIATVLRAWQLERWLPAYYEEATPVLRAMAFWADFRFDPGFYNYPALSFYAQFLGQAGYLFWTLIQGGSLVEFRQGLEAAAPNLVLLGRWVTVFCDLGTVAAAFWLGRKVGDARVGLLAAGLVAVNALHVRLAQYVLVDVPLALCMLVALGWIVDLTRAPSRSAYFKAGLGIGVAAAVKYTAGLVALPLAAVALLGSRRDWTGALLAGLAALGIFFALNPYILWHFDAFWHDFTYEREHMALGHFGQDRAQWTVAFYAVELAWAVGVVGLVALWGLRDAMRRRAADGLVLYCWVGVYLLLISTWEMRGARYLLPVVPVLLVLGAQGLWRQRMRGVLVAVLVVYGGTQAWALNDHYAALTAPDTREQVAEWVEDLVSPEALMAIEHYTYYPGPEGSDHRLFRLPIDVVHPERFAGLYAREWYGHFDYVLVSSFVYRRYLEDPERFPVQAAFYRHLEN
ncbi:MAG: glycosyltransferase family 39 protein, partial [Candidatus Latescibacteria bacterium]|nr:glycosyltransferase family 39 protein [Candidatus Latescibacterota bacterium]